MNDRFLRACWRQLVDCTPVWFMRQAGRYQPEYQALRQKYSLLEICHEPELCAQVTLLPVRQLDVDAAILFSDIMLPVEAMGISFELCEDVGPVIETPIRRPNDVTCLRVLEPAEDLSFVLQTIHLLRHELDVPLIGFAGAPFTLASYLIEGGPSRDFAKTKSFMYRERGAWATLMERLAQSVLKYLEAQIAAGAQAVQLFDSWVGCLSPEDYKDHVLPHMRRLFAQLNGLGVPIIHFGVGTGHLLGLMREAGGDVIGLDWRVGLGRAWAELGYDVGVQGNLDPAALLGPWELVEQKALGILQQAGGRPGHIFNLGHGVLPETSPDVLKRLVELVHERSAQEGGPG